MIHIAAAGDLHFAEDLHGSLRPHLDDLAGRVDAFLIAGDLTRHGEADEAAVLADELDGLDIPTIAVLGNHDYHLDEEKKIRDLIEGAGVTVLENESTVLSVRGEELGIAGVKGFGGGFTGAEASNFGEPEMKAFIRHTMEIAAQLREVMASLHTERRVVLMHYSPVEQTLEGEPVGIHAFLGSRLLGEAVDEHGADLILHGHAHAGSEKGATTAGIPVRNVALPVIEAPYRMFRIAEDTEPDL